jgi:hypothetical protein
MFKAGQPITWTTETRSGWSRFIVSLMIRNPEYVARVAAEVVGFFDPASGLADKYRAIRRADDPETYDGSLRRLVTRPDEPAPWQCKRLLIVRRWADI